MRRSAVVLLAAAGLMAAGCARRAAERPVAERTLNGARVSILAPGGRLLAGENRVAVTISLADARTPLADDTVHVAFTPRDGEGRVVALDLPRRSTGRYEGAVRLGAAGSYWGEATYDGPDGTQSVRLPVEVK